jgi:hypothetical protein
MKTIFTIVLSFLCFIAKSQDIIHLDRKNGFKNFIIGDSLSKYGNQLKWNKKYYWYEPRGSAIKVDNYPVRVGLQFINNVLYQINVYVYGSNGTNHVHQLLNNAYGQGDEKLNEEHARYVEWDGQRVKLVFTKDVLYDGGLSGYLVYTKTSDLKTQDLGNEYFPYDL